MTAVDVQDTPTTPQVVWTPGTGPAGAEYTATIGGLVVELYQWTFEPTGHAEWRYQIVAQVDGIPVTSLGRGVETLEEIRAEAHRVALILAARGWKPRS